MSHQVGGTEERPDAVWMDVVVGGEGKVKVMKCHDAAGGERRAQEGE